MWSHIIAGAVVAVLGLLSTHVAAATWAIGSKFASRRASRNVLAGAVPARQRLVAAADRADRGRADQLDAVLDSTPVV